MQLRLFTEPRQGARYEDLLSEKDGVERLYPPMLDLRDLEHPDFLARGIAPQLD